MAWAIVGCLFACLWVTLLVFVVRDVRLGYAAGMAPQRRSAPIGGYVVCGAGIALSLYTLAGALASWPPFRRWKG